MAWVIPLGCVIWNIPNARLISRNLIGDLSTRGKDWIGLGRNQLSRESTLLFTHSHHKSFVAYLVTRGTNVNFCHIFPYPRVQMTLSVIIYSRSLNLRTGSEVF